MKNLLSNLRIIGSKVFTLEEYKKFLTLAAHFPNLSLYNLLLLYYQMPNATLIAGQNAWKNNYNLDVKEEAKAIALLKPSIIDEEETTIGYEQIGVFDVSQLTAMPEIKKDEFSIPDWFHETTGLNVSYDNQEILGDKEYDFLGDEILVKFNPHLSAEENELNIAKYLLTAYIYSEDYRGLGGDVRGKNVAQSVLYILCMRYGLPLPVLTSTVIANCKGYGLPLLKDILDTTHSIIEEIENQIYIDLSFADIAFINLLVEANSQEDYEVIREWDIQDDEELLNELREAFVDKLQYISPKEFNHIVEERKNNKMMTQPPCRIKLIEE